MKLIFWMLVLSCLAYGGTCPTDQPKNESALIQIEQTWARSLEQSDTAALGCILAEGFEDVGVDGSLSDRATTLAKAGEKHAAHHELTELHAHVQGDLGYIRGLAAVVDGQGKIVGKARFTDVYAYREGRWQCLAGHETIVRGPQH